MTRRTKIVATIGPATESPEAIEKLITAGVDFFRFNLKHNSLEWHKKAIELIERCCQKRNKKLGIIADIQGPELRVETKDTEGLMVEEGETIYLAKEFINDKTLVINPKEVFEQLAKGWEAYVDNGNLHLTFEGRQGETIVAKAGSRYLIKNRKAINVPGIGFDLPLFTQRDLEALDRLKELNVDYLALSFVRSKDDILELKKIIKEKGVEAGVMAKIENGSAIANLKEIVDESDAVMIARGDLGVEVPIRQLAFWQKLIIQLCRQKNTPVLVATQMLISMVNNSHPTRAEATDVANAVYDASDALMLSEETAVGNYPVRAVEEMDKICRFVEEYGKVNEIKDELEDAAEVLCDAACRIIKEAKFPVKAVLVFTQSGKTARIMARHRLGIPVIAITDKMRTYRQLNLSYGVIPYYKQFGKTEFRKDDPIFEEIKALGVVTEGDDVVAIHGNNWLSSGSTSDLSVIRF